MWGTKPTNLLLPLAHSFAAHSKDSLRTEHMHRQRLLTSSYSYSTPARKPDARHALASLRLPGAPVHAGASAQGSGAWESEREVGNAAMGLGHAWDPGSARSLPTATAEARFRACSRVRGACGRVSAGRGLGLGHACGCTYSMHGTQLHP